MCRRCFYANAQDLGDLFGRVPLGDQLQHLSLAWGQLFVRACVLADKPQIVSDHVFGYRWAEIGFTARDGSDREFKLGSIRVLEQITGRPRAQSL